MRIQAILQQAVMIAIVAVLPSAPAHARKGDMGVFTHMAAAWDSTYVVWLNDISIPEIPNTMIEPRRGMPYAERLAMMADMGLPIAIKMRATQSAPDAYRQCLWVGGKIEPAGQDDNPTFVWPSDQVLCARFRTGECICADSMFVLPAGDVLTPLTPIRIWPRRNGWSAAFRSIEVRHSLGEVTHTVHHVFVAFRAGEFVRRKLDWKDCTGIELRSVGDQAAAHSPAASRN